MYDVRRGKPDFDDSAEGGRRRAQSSLLPVLVVLGFGLGLIVMLIGFTGVAGLYIVLAIGGVMCFAGLHYVLWGWWLTNRIQAEADDDED